MKSIPLSFIFTFLVISAVPLHARRKKHPDAPYNSFTGSRTEWSSAVKMARPKKTHSLLALGAFAASVAVAAWYGSRYNPKTRRNKLWYARLNKPSYNPPDYVFPVVWTTLYSLMALSGWRVWRSKASEERSRALALWMKQLATNAQWTKIFFGEHRPKRALANIVLLDYFLAKYIFTAYKVDRPAAFYFVPYVGWVTFAGVLNADIVRRNPDTEKRLAA